MAMGITRINMLSATAIFLIAFLSAGCSVFGIHDYESPGYTLLLKDGNKEIRQYQPYIVARTAVKGGFKEAQSAAFGILADYIFGNNLAKQKISMTGPVVQKPESGGEKLAMTAPVTQSPSGQGWVMTFMMPSEYGLADLPAPKDKRISLEKVPAKLMAAIKYSWYGSEEKNAEKASELEKWLLSLNQYQMVSAPMFAGYDPPWTLPFFRRNEMLIEVQKRE
jgi:hypothetical protein